MRSHTEEGRHGRVMRVAATGWGVIVPVLMLATLLLGPVRGAAAVPKDGLLQETKAYAAFETLVAHRHATADMPLLSDPAASSVLHRLWDVGAVLGQPPYTAADNQPLDSIMAVQWRVLSQYIKAARKAGNAAAAHGDKYYGAEISRAQAFLLAASPALFESASEGLKSVDLAHLTVHQKQHLKPFSLGMKGVTTLFETAIRTLSHDGFSADNKRVIAAALSQYASRLAVQITPAERMAIIGTAARAIGKAGSTAMKDLEHLMVAMSTRQCATLCRIGELVATNTATPAPRPAPAAVAQARLQPTPQPQPAAATGTNVLVPRPAIGVKFGSEPPYVCRSKTMPRTGPITPDLARQYFICEHDAASGGSLTLVTNVRVEVGQALSRDQVRHSYVTDADSRSPIYAIRGSFDKYVCEALGGADGITLGAHKCGLFHNHHASGICYRNSFDDWNCGMSDSTAAQIANQMPPGPVSAQEIAIARRTAPMRPIERGMHLFLQGNYAGAYQSFKSVLARNPNDPLAGFWQGIVQVKSGNIWADNRFSELDSYPAAQELLALDDWRRGGSANAKTHLESCIHHSNRAIAARCADMESGVERGASAPPIKDWPADVGLVKATQTLANR